MPRFPSLFSFARNRKFIVSGAAACAVAVIAAGMTHARLGGVRAEWTPKTAAVSQAREGRPLTARPAGVTTFVAPGLRVALESAAADSDRGRQTFTLSAVNKGGEKLEEMEVALLAFTPEGRLARVERHRLPLSAEPEAKQTVSFGGKLIQHDPSHRLLLAVRGLTGTTRRHEVRELELIEKLSRQARGGGGGTPNPHVSERARGGGADFTPDVCYESFMLAHELARDLGLTVAGNTCDRYRLSFAISFAPTPGAN